jgi:hypothetical protein
MCRIIQPGRATVSAARAASTTPLMGFMIKVAGPNGSFGGSPILGDRIVHRAASKRYLDRSDQYQGPVHGAAVRSGSVIHAHAAKASPLRAGPPSRLMAYRADDVPDGRDGGVTGAFNEQLRHDGDRRSCLHE